MQNDNGTNSIYNRVIYHFKHQPENGDKGDDFFVNADGGISIIESYLTHRKGTVTLEPVEMGDLHKESIDVKIQGDLNWKINLAYILSSNLGKGISVRVSL